MSEANAPAARGKRARTARRIQRATLDLAATVGFDAVTIDMIAERAEVSRRTFFNHYGNKQEAIVGPQPERFGPHLDWFVTSDGRLLTDLRTLVSQVLNDASPERDVVRSIGAIIKASPDLRPVFAAMIDTIAGEIELLLARRLGRGDQRAAQLIGRMVAHSIVLSFESWAEGGDAALEDIATVASDAIDRVADALTGGGVGENGNLQTKPI